MQVIKAKELGFCMGVRRAVDMMEAAAGEMGPITSLGSTVHNPQVVDRLRGRGVDVIATLESIDARPVAITAHGVGPDVMQELQSRGAAVVDTTRHLADVARERGVETYHVESASELDPAWFAGRDRVGVAAGASTPDAVIDEVVARLQTLAA